MKLNLSAFLVLLVSFSCSDSHKDANNRRTAKDESQSAPKSVSTTDAHPSPPILKGTDQNRLPLPIDFESQAESSVNDNNYKDKLLELEGVINKQPKKE